MDPGLSPPHPCRACMQPTELLQPHPHLPSSVISMGRKCRRARILSCSLLVPVPRTQGMGGRARDEEPTCSAATCSFGKTGSLAGIWILPKLDFGFSLGFATAHSKDTLAYSVSRTSGLVELVCLALPDLSWPSLCWRRNTAIPCTWLLLGLTASLIVLMQAKLRTHFLKYSFGLCVHCLCLQAHSISFIPPVANVKMVYPWPFQYFKMHH